MKTFGCISKMAHSQFIVALIRNLQIICVFSGAMTTYIFRFSFNKFVFVLPLFVPSYLPNPFSPLFIHQGQIITTPFPNPTTYISLTDHFMHHVVNYHVIYPPLPVPGFVVNSFLQAGVLKLVEDFNDYSESNPVAMPSVLQWIFNYQMTFDFILSFILFHSFIAYVILICFIFIFK